MNLTPGQIHALAELALMINTNRQARMAFRAMCDFERTLVDVAGLGRMDYGEMRRKVEVKR